MMKSLMNKVEPNRKSFQNFNKLMELCRQLLLTISSGRKERL
jgi:hypothetical protein